MQIDLSKRSSFAPSSSPPPPHPSWKFLTFLKKLFVFLNGARKLDQFPPADASQGFTSPTVRYNLCQAGGGGRNQVRWRRRLSTLLPLRGNLGSREVETLGFTIWYHERHT